MLVSLSWLQIPHHLACTLSESQTNRARSTPTIQWSTELRPQHRTDEKDEIGAVPWASTDNTASNTIIMVLRQHTHAGKEDVLKELRPSLFRLSQVPCKAQERVRTLETPQCWREQHQCEILARWRGRSSVTRRKRANHSRPTTRPQSLSHVNRDFSHKARPPKMGLNDFAAGMSQLRLSRGSSKNSRAKIMQ